MERNDQEAVRLLKLAADQGLARAQFNLALCYANGQGVGQDDREAVRWCVICVLFVCLFLSLMYEA